MVVITGPDNKKKTIESKIVNTLIFSYPLALGAQTNHLIEMLILSTHKRVFGWEIRFFFKITHSYVYLEALL